MSTATSLFALSTDQIVAAILANGAKRTVIVEGGIGIGKSAVLRMLAKALLTHIPVHCDCTTKDVGDLMMPNFKAMKGGADYVTFVPNEEMGVHLKGPIALMMDEVGKNRAIHNAVLRLLYERKLGSYTLHPDSIIFGTTNLGAENVGDMLPAHMRNRVTFVQMRKPTAMEWIENFGIGNDVDHTVLGWVKDNPHVMDSFEDVRDPEENPYIYHPKSSRRAFVTPRSLEAASDWIKQRATLDPQTLTAMLIGTVGERAGLDLASFVELADQLPTLESIRTAPQSAKVPDSPAAVCMVVFRALQGLDASWAPQWLEYMARLGEEAQGMFVNGVRNPKYSDAKRSMLMKLPGFSKWCIRFGYLYGADKA